MIVINATGDTTLHTAGKYCAEDILVKVPAGSGSGGNTVEKCTVTFDLINTMDFPYARWVEGDSVMEVEIPGTPSITIPKNTSLIIGDILSGRVSCVNYTSMPITLLETNYHKVYLIVEDLTMVFDAY